MQRKVMVDALINKVLFHKNLKLIHEPNYGKATEIIKLHEANAALIEIPESGKYNVQYCLTLCRKIKILTPACKLLLMCSEQDESGIHLVVKAKKNKFIDDFVFYDVSIDYLSSKLLGL
ncbi:MAG: hypothetical protein GX829_09825 [Clostridium sp.]|nr:hypothetical protein [Clostridium sp.]